LSKNFRASSILEGLKYPVSLGYTAKYVHFGI
jgi:hypothetical protein